MNKTIKVKTLVITLAVIAAVLVVGYVGFNLIVEEMFKDFTIY